jgi:alcohol dehydrogenase class IV
MDFKNLGAKKVCVVTDSTVSKLDAMKQVVEGLSREGVEFTIFDKVRVEPKDSSYVFVSLCKGGEVNLFQDQGSNCFRQAIPA